MFKKKGNWRILILGTCLILFCTCHIFTTAQTPQQLYVGWSTKTITPDKPVALAGQFHTRISREVMDPVTCTALALETRDGSKSVETAIMVSCDLAVIRGSLYEEVTGLLKKELPGFDPNKLVLNATHTHAGPVLKDYLMHLYPLNEDQLNVVHLYTKIFKEKVLQCATKAFSDIKSAKVFAGFR